jgi:hypothetical protein
MEGTRLEIISILTKLVSDIKDDRYGEGDDFDLDAFMDDMTTAFEETGLYINTH